MRSKSPNNSPAIRSVADIFDHLDGTNGESSRFIVRFLAEPFPTPDGKRSGFIVAIAECQQTGDSQKIDMPTCSGFRADAMDGTAMPGFGIELLDGAIAYPDHTVRLKSDGHLRTTTVKNVSFNVAPIDYNFSDIEHAVVRLAIECIEQEYKIATGCYREPYPEVVPGFKMLDYAAVAKTKMPSNKGVVGYIETNLESMLRSKTLTPKMNDELELWLAGSSATAAIKRTLKRSGLGSSRGN